jgi:hypothetical protein
LFYWVYIEESRKKAKKRKKMLAIFGVSANNILAEAGHEGNIA